MTDRLHTGWLVALIFVTAIPVAAQQTLPPELEPFVKDEMQWVTFDSADLNLDKLDDFVFVLEPQTSDQSMDDPDFDPYEIKRTLLVLVRNAKGKLEIASKSDRAVLCAGCGGMLGDPFQGIDAGRGKFTIEHYGGSAWRWGNKLTFGYSRRDKAWQLVRVEETSFHATEPDKEERGVFTPPQDFGKINLEDFDPENWKGVGPK